KEKSIDNFKDWLTQQDINLFLNRIVLDSNLSKTEENKTYLNLLDVSKEIRDPEVTEEIKHIAVVRDVRDFVNKNLYKLSASYKIVMDGRDIGTEVFPDAYLKIYLTADPEVRARRRYDEYSEKGVNIDFNQLKEEIIRRDESDLFRKIAPLKKADDAILIDTSNLSKNIVINMILSRL
ncbi:MAG: (d)CMP kinase, partial [Spirochaetia bacterium]|nr:(d)CMP kinase [Spirochaetia bacterium]